MTTTDVSRTHDILMNESRAPAYAPERDSAEEQELVARVSNRVPYASRMLAGCLSSAQTLAEPAHAAVFSRAPLLRLVNLGRAVIPLSSIPGPTFTTTQVNVRRALDSDKPGQRFDCSAAVARPVDLADQGVKLCAPGEHAGRDPQRFRQTKEYRAPRRPPILDPGDRLARDTGTARELRLRQVGLRPPAAQVDRR